MSGVGVANRACRLRWLTLGIVLCVARSRPNTFPANLCCTLEMLDSFGDGWDGSTLTIIRNTSATNQNAVLYEGATFLQLLFYPRAR